MLVGNTDGPVLCCMPIVPIKKNVVCQLFLMIFDVIIPIVSFVPHLVHSKIMRLPFCFF